jgi:hypothetical protein
VINAHKLVLSAGSGYLEQVLAATPCEHPIIVLANVKYNQLKLLVDFMYTGTYSSFANILIMLNLMSTSGAGPVTQRSLEPESKF